MIHALCVVLTLCLTLCLSDDDDSDDAIAAVIVVAAVLASLAVLVAAAMALLHLQERKQRRHVDNQISALDPLMTSSSSSTHVIRGTCLMHVAGGVAMEREETDKQEERRDKEM